MSTGSPEKAVENIKEKFWKLWHIGKYYWPIANFVVYHFAPFHMRQVVVDIFAFFYSIIMSFVNNMTASGAQSTVKK